MTVVATTASVQFGTGGVTEVESRLHPTGRTYINCHTYADSAPILSIDDAHVQVTISVPDAHWITEEDVTVARQLADAAARYLAELEKLAAVTREKAEGPGDCAGQAA